MSGDCITRAKYRSTDNNFTFFLNFTCDWRQLLMTDAGRQFFVVCHGLLNRHFSSRLYRLIKKLCVRTLGDELYSTFIALPVVILLRQWR